MCGIVGYVSAVASDRAKNVTLAGLKRLEYRGYDSAGVALVGSADSKLQVRKKAGRLDCLVDEIKKNELNDASCAIGHTRWATHGKPTDENAHPHVSNDGRIALIHNGIIENAGILRDELKKNGVVFVSETDTEVAAHLLRQTIGNDESHEKFVNSMREIAKLFKGTFTLLAVDAKNPNIVVGARHDSPLVVGIGDGENFLGSDATAFASITKKAIELGQDQIVKITPDSVEIFDFDGNRVEGKEYVINWDTKAAEKGGYNTFMEKEIHEEPAAIANTLLGRIDQLTGTLKLDESNLSVAELSDKCKQIDKIIVVACGTAAYAGHVAKYAIEQWCQVPVEVELAHEFRYRDAIVNSKTLVISISQSGETMDTLMAVRHAKQYGAFTIAICNTQGSTIPRESDSVLYTHAGPEVAVASTKAFVAQITASYLIGLFLASERSDLNQEQIGSILDELHEMPEKVQKLVDQFEYIGEIAKELKDVKSVLFLGRNIGYPVALEGALKLKELAYIHAEGFAAGELKHGPIALIDEGQIVFVILPPLSKQELHSKVISNIQEIRSRGAKVIAVASENDEEAKEQAGIVLRRPDCPALLSPLTDVIPLQIFALQLAKAKGLDVDQPRNLAKSVTVE